MTKLTEAQFLKDVSNHKLTIFQDDGIRRHLRFSPPDSGNMYFDLVTWPGWLCYCGDMGTHVFSRVDDMFRFFRKSPDGPIEFDEQYWAQKCQASGSFGIYEYSPAIAVQALRDYLADCEASDEVREAVADEDLESSAKHGEDAFRSHVYEFNHDGFQIDMSETRLCEYTFRFLWCCHALVWGIRQYDAQKVVATDAPE